MGIYPIVAGFSVHLSRQYDNPCEEGKNMDMSDLLQLARFPWTGPFLFNLTLFTCPLVLNVRDLISFLVTITYPSYFFT